MFMVYGGTLRESNSTISLPPFLVIVKSYRKQGAHFYKSRHHFGRAFYFI